MNNDLEVAYPESGSFCSGPGRIGIWKCWFVTGLIRGRLKRATSFFIAFCNNRPLHRCTVISCSFYRIIRKRSGGLMIS